MCASVAIASVASSGVAQAASSTSACQATVAKEVKQAEQPMHYVVPKQAVPGSALKGKTIATIVTRNVPSPAGIAKGIQQAGAALGAKVLTYYGDGTVQSWQSDIQLAATRGAKYFDFISIPAQDINKTVEGLGKGVHYVDVEDVSQPSDPLIGIDFAHVQPSAVQEGQDAALGMLQATDCKLSMTAFTYPTLPANDTIGKTAVATVEKLCSSCKAELNALSLSADPTTIQQDVQTEMQRNSGTNYVFGTNDAIALDAIPAAKPSNVPVAGVNCDTDVLSLIAAHNGEKIDVCQAPVNYIGWAVADELLRAAAGKPRAVYAMPAELVGQNSKFNASNPFPDFGNYEAAFKKLWDVH